MTDWINWHGGDVPLDFDRLVAVRWRSGHEWRAKAGGFQWAHAVEPRDYDIVAYLPLEDQRKSSQPARPSQVAK